MGEDAYLKFEPTRVFGAVQTSCAPQSGTVTLRNLLVP